MLCVQNAYLQKSTIKRTGYNDDIYFNIKEHTCTTVPVKLPKCQSFLRTFIKASALFHVPCEYSVTRLSQRLLPNVVLKFYQIGFFLPNTCKFRVLKFLAACSHCSHVLHPFWPFSWRQHNETVLDMKHLS